jgi:hypothetical protein
MKSTAKSGAIALALLTVFGIASAQSDAASGATTAAPAASKNYGIPTKAPAKPAATAPSANQGIPTTDRRKKKTASSTNVYGLQKNVKTKKATEPAAQGASAAASGS